MIDAPTALPAGLPPCWHDRLGPLLQTPTLQALATYLRARKQAGATIYPPGRQFFNAFNTTPFNAVRVVILGQDPYHGPGQAHGLSFSVLPGVPVPPSLQNIFKEIEADLGLPTPRHGYLQSWAEQGVLLLNSVLSVEAGQARSHAGKGWEDVTDHAISRLSQERTHLVFMLWGSFAQAKQPLIDPTRHLVLTAPHPSPLSAHQGFLGCRHFSQANAYLQQQGLPPIDWALPAQD